MVNTGRWAFVPYVGVVLLVLLACKGSSVIESASGHGKAKVHFSVDCTDGLLLGQFRLYDPHAKVQFDAVATRTVPDCADPPDFFTGAISGTYSPQPATRGEGGTFTLSGVDNPPSGPSGSDTFELTLDGGVYDGYHSEGSWLRGRWDP